MKVRIVKELALYGFWKYYMDEQGRVINGVNPTKRGVEQPQFLSLRPKTNQVTLRTKDGGSRQFTYNTLLKHFIECEHFDLFVEKTKFKNAYKYVNKIAV